MYFVYVLRCGDGSLYCGSTPDYKRRIKEHFLRLPAAAKYTKSHRVTGVECVWEADDKVAAMKLEYRFKKLQREKKLRLLENPSAVGKLIPELSGYSFSNITGVKIEDCLN